MPLLRWQALFRLWLYATRGIWSLDLGLIASEEVASDALLSTSFDCLLGAAGTRRWDDVGLEGIKRLRVA